METIVYVLCAVTAFACCALLIRAYGHRHVALLLWCGLFFLALTAENILLFIDVIVVPRTDLTVLRRGIALIGTLLLLYGLIGSPKAQ
ncbi:MAG: hypothetical protein HYS13_08290 [Planctomycetia bacterium]|nr:hypothetical protein [Planctomycetia bacterium]